MRHVMGLLAGLTFLVGSTNLRADEKIEIKDLPKVAVEALKAKFPKAEIVGAEIEMKAGKKIFDIKIKEEKHELSVEINEEGKIVEIQKKIEAKDLPKAVADAIEAKFPKSKIDEAKEVTIGEVVSFKVKVTTAENSHFRLELDATGKILKTEEKKKEPAKM